MIVGQQTRQLATSSVQANAAAAAASAPPAKVSGDKVVLVLVQITC